MLSQMKVAPFPSTDVNSNRSWRAELSNSTFCNDGNDCADPRSSHEPHAATENLNGGWHRLSNLI